MKRLQLVACGCRVDQEEVVLLDGSFAARLQKGFCSLQEFVGQCQVQLFKLQRLGKNVLVKAGEDSNSKCRKIEFLKKRAHTCRSKSPQT